MLKLIRELFRKESLLDEAFEETCAMLGLARDMTRAATASLRHSDSAEVALDIHKADIRINKYERETRRRVLTHLSISTAVEHTAALVLTSIVIDVERLGDYAKNIVELAQAHPSALNALEYEDRVRELERRIMDGFDQVTEAFRDSDADKASQLMATHKDFTRLVDDIVDQLIAGDDSLVKGEAVTLALYIRYLKRAESHLNNIVSSVVNPFPRIGYQSKSQIKRSDENK
jgi:phosphate uptake regulator